MADKLDYLSKYRDPLNIFSQYIDTVESKLTDGAEVVDTKNIFSFIVEFNSYMTGHLVNEICDVFPALYPSRAQTSEELYKHLADNEYLGLFNTPASCTLEILLDKQFLIDNAKPYNDNYNKVIIPKESTFALEQFSFGIYYPIEIRINKVTNTFHVSYDTATYGNNPLHALHQNTIEHRIINYKGLELLSFRIPIYQFTTFTAIDDIVYETGFAKSYDYTDGFYAIRVYNYIDDKWEEMEKTFSDKIYDPQVPTVKIAVESELSRVKVIIPQIYFTSDKIGTKIKVEYYTSIGEMDVDATDIAPEDIKVKFVSSTPEIQTYANIFNSIKTLDVYPASKRIIGGTNGKSFRELQTMIINNAFYNNVLISPQDIAIWMNANGFKLANYRDGITNRTYDCLKAFTDPTGDTLPAANLATRFTKEILDNTNTIASHKDGTYTIYSNTWYEYDKESDTTRVLTNEEVERLNTLSSTDIVDEFNTKIYTMSPLYTKLTTNSQYPYAMSYDLDRPTIESIDFIEENIEMSTQLTVISAAISCKNVCEGYLVTLIVSRTKDIIDVEAKDIKICVIVKSNSGAYLYEEAIYMGTSLEGYDKYTIPMSSKYIITADHEIYIDDLIIEAGETDCPIPLNPKLDLIFLINKTVVPTGASDEGNMRAHLPVTIYDDYVALSEQSLSVIFGNLIHCIDNKINLSFTDKTYATYKIDEYAYYNGDVFKTDENGIPLYDRKINIIGKQSLTYTKGSNIVTDEDAIMLNVGMFITSCDFPFYTYIKEINGNKVTLNNAALVDGVGVATDIGTVIVKLTYLHTLGDWMFHEETVIRTTASFKEKTLEVTVADITDIVVGMKISGEGISRTSTIINIEDSVLTLDKQCFQDETDVSVEVGIPKIIHKAGDLILDYRGEPILNEDRQEILYTDKIHVDGKLFKITGLATPDYRKICLDLLSDYDIIAVNLKQQLAENTSIYYKPIKSLGYGTFLINENANTLLPLELSLELKIYVYDYIYSDLNILEKIKTESISIVEKGLSANELSIVNIAESIRTYMPDYIKYVDVLGINDNINIQTLVNTTDQTCPILKRRLYLNDENSIKLEKDLQITFISINKDTSTF